MMSLLFLQLSDVDINEHEKDEDVRMKTVHIFSHPMLDYEFHRAFMKKSNVTLPCTT